MLESRRLQQSKRWLLILLTGLFMLGPTWAAEPTPSDQEHEVDTVMQRQMAARHIPGAAIAIVSHGQIVLTKGYGLADVEQSVAVTENTVFQLASVSKQFTATAIMMLVQEGKLSLESKLTGIIDGLPATWNAITIRQLLNHTSGIPEFGKKLNFQSDLRKDYTERQIIGLVADEPLDFVPGARLSYSNSGYFLLGMVIEKISGMTYGDFLKKRIFQPLGMTATRFNDLRAVIPHRARGYTLDDATLRNAEYVNPAIPFAAGGLLSSAADMAKWSLALGSEKLLKAASWEEMWSPGKLNDGTTTNYGFGWYIRNKWSRKRLEHGGAIQGFSNDINHFVDGDLTVVVLTNLEGAEAGRIELEIFGFFLSDTRFKPPAPIADKDADTTKFLRQVTVSLSHGTGDPQWFTPVVQQYYFPDRIKERKTMLGVFGPLTSFELIGDQSKPDGRTRSYRAVFGQIPFHFAYQLTPAGKIAGVDFRPE